MFLSYEALKRHHIDTNQQREREKEKEEEEKEERNEERAKEELEVVIMKFFFI
jgi:ribosomal protein L12E/L44/L45/RPP1/RPP2